MKEAVKENTGLEGLHDISVPEPVSWMPQTAGWVLLLVILASLIIWMIYRYARHRRENLYRRSALERLSRIEKVPAEIPALVKSTVLSFRPREEVASLTGDAWLAFLDKTDGSVRFTKGPGRLLAQIAYLPEPELEKIPSNEIGPLVELVRDWIRNHNVSV